jgi:hypothetical protein
MKPSYCTSCGKPLSASAQFCTSCGAKNVPAAVPAPAAGQAAPPPSPPVKKIMSRRTKLIYGAAVAVIFAVFLYLFTDHLPGGAHPVIKDQPEIAMATMYMGKVLQPFAVTATVDQGQIRVPLSAVQEHKIIEFEYRTENNIIPLMAYISAEGKLVTSIRMCEPCNSDHFRIEGMELCCSRCETRWKLNNLEGIQGSCQKYPPDPVPSILVQDQSPKTEYIAIDERVVRRWKMRI